MKNYKYILAAGTAILLPVSVAADTCGTLPSCASIGFTYSAADCGNLKKLKCPFGDAYFCSGSDCKSVSVNPKTEKCTKYCESDKNICVEKRAMTCSELLSANSCTRYNDGATIRGNISRDICVFGTVKQATGTNSSLTFTQTTVWDAGKRWAACKSEMKGRAKLDLGSITIENGTSFYTDVDINNITYSPQSERWNAHFYGNTRIHVTWRPSSSWVGALSLYFSGIYNTSTGEVEKTINEVSVSCEAIGDRYRPSICEVSINPSIAEVTYCGQVVDAPGCNGGCYGEVEFNCDGVSGDPDSTCKKKNSGCTTYWY